MSGMRSGIWVCELPDVCWPSSLVCSCITMVLVKVKVVHEAGAVVVVETQSGALLLSRALHGWCLRKVECLLRIGLDP